MKINDVANLLSIERILVIQKPSGSGIFTLSIIPGKSDDQLVAAFLTALGSFISEMKQSVPSRGLQLLTRKMEEIIGHERFIIFLIEGQNVAVAAILKEEPHDQNLLEKRLRKLTKTIENKYQSELTNFQGNLKVFEGMKEITNEHLFISLMETPWIFQQKMAEDKSWDEEIHLVRSILWKVQSRLSEDEGLYFDELTKICLKKSGILGYLEVIKTLLILIKNRELIPAIKNIKLPSIQLRDLDVGAELDLASVEKPPLSYETTPTTIMTSTMSKMMTTEEKEPTIPRQQSAMEELEETFQVITTEEISTQPEVSFTRKDTHKILNDQFPSTKIDESHSILQLLINDATIEDVDVNELSSHSTGIPEHSVSTMVNRPSTPEEKSTQFIDKDQFIRDIESIPESDLPFDLLVDILKRDLVFDLLNDPRAKIDEHSGTRDELLEILKTLMTKGTIIRSDTNAVGGKVVFIQPFTTKNKIKVITMTRHAENNAFIWLIAEKRIEQ